MLPLSKRLSRRIQAEAVQRLSFRNSPDSNLYLLDDVIKKGKSIDTPTGRIRFKQDSVLVFADEAPLFNWGHPCSYMLFDAKSGRVYDERRDTFPPFLIEPPENFVAFHKPVEFSPQEPLPIKPDLWPLLSKAGGKRYAILFSGASNNRHVNDLEFLYRTLMDDFGFDDSRIRVLNYDGTVNYSGNPQPVGDWPGDNTPYRMPVHSEGTKAALENEIDALKGKLKKNDLLLIHTNNHGSHNGTESQLVTYSGPWYRASVFAAKLGELPRFGCLVVMMEQCNSGGFNAPIINSSPADRTSVSSACEELRNSIGGPNFDPFARDWVSAIHGADPFGGVLASDPDTNGDGKVSAREAFAYANSIHNPYDTPVYSESSTSAGECHLGFRGMSILRVKYPWLERLLGQFRDRLPPNEFAKAFHSEVLPKLSTIDRKFTRQLEKMSKEVRTEVEDIVQDAFKGP